MFARPPLEREVFQHEFTRWVLMGYSELTYGTSVSVIYDPLHTVYGRDLMSVQMEDFGKRNMPGKRARRHFSQLSDFERGLIIGMKTAGWSTRRVAGQVDRSECAIRNCWEQWTREGTHARKIGSVETRNTTRREDRRIVRQALVDHTVTRSAIREDVGVAIVP
ncbi:uncharacterized protein TNCV_4180221 [Trichonephila clavipes]|nr:uncharacterized protein TNCV_4180221 [Trichonephila clavipes]